MQMKKNKALLLGSTVLFSVMGSIEKANSTEIQNEINIVNNEKPVVINSAEEVKAPRTEDEIKADIQRINEKLQNEEISERAANKALGQLESELKDKIEANKAEKEINEKNNKKNDNDIVIKEVNELELNKIYEQETGQKVPDSVKQIQNDIIKRFTIETKKPLHATVIEHAPSKTWYGKAWNKVTQIVTNAWSSIKTGWSKVKSVFKWK